MPSVLHATRVPLCTLRAEHSSLRGKKRRRPYSCLASIKHVLSVAWIQSRGLKLVTGLSPMKLRASNTGSGTC